MNVVYRYTERARGANKQATKKKQLTTTTKIVFVCIDQQQVFYMLLLTNYMIVNMSTVWGAVRCWRPRGCVGVKINLSNEYCLKKSRRRRGVVVFCAIIRHFFSLSSPWYILAVFLTFLLYDFSLFSLCSLFTPILLSSFKLLYFSSLINSKSF